MPDKYMFDGRFSAGSRQDVTGPLVILVDECSLSVIGSERGLSHSTLRVAPFHGGMVFGTSHHSEREHVLEKGYELVLSGTTLGMYDDGGGRDGEFDVFRIKDVRIRGAFGPAGLTISIRAHTHPGAQVCYSAREWRENAYEPIEVTTEFTVPPKHLQAFMGLRFSVDHEMFARFKWS
jgi:hypothetical protein